MKTGRPLSGTSKREKISSYSSPYVAKAQEKALQRAREARKHLPRNGFTRNEWDSTPKSPGGVFDPSIRKKEIFRIEPRVPSENTVDNSIGNISFHSQDKPRPSSRMTVRTNVVITCILLSSL